MQLVMKCMMIKIDLEDYILLAISSGLEEVLGVCSIGQVVVGFS